MAFTLNSSRLIATASSLRTDRRRFGITLLLIFTDLDGTLLNPDDYRYDDAIPVIQKLQTQKIPIVPVTSKTRKEVEVLCIADFPGAKGWA